MKLKRIVWIVGAILIALFIYRMGARILNSSKVQVERVTPVVTITPKTGTIQEKLTLTGDVKGETEVSVRPRIAGRVEEIYVEEGNFVQKGTKLLSFVAGIKPDSDIYEDMIVRSPISGVVGQKLVKVGEQVTSQLAIINPVFVIYKVDTMKIYANVPEKYYSAVSAGAPAYISLDAFPDKVFKGYVHNVRPVLDPISRTAQIEIRLANPGNVIKPGMFANVDVVLKSRSNVLIIPFDSVLGDGEQFVYVDDKGRAKKKTVKTGIQQDNDVEVVSGLSSLDKVITVGQRVVRDGYKVEEAK